MTKNHTEKDLIKFIEDCVAEKLPEEAGLFTLENLVVGSIRKSHGSGLKDYCTFDVNDHGILVVIVNDIKPNKEVIYHNFKFSDIQGIIVKSKGLFCNVTLQFIDGRNYLFEFTNHRTKNNPNQKEHLKYIIDTLESRGLNNMRNDMHKQNKKSQRKTEFSYIVTLVVFLFLAASISISIFSNSVVIVIVILLAAVLHFILFLLTTLYLNAKKDRPFFKEYNPIVLKYNEDGNSAELLNELLHMNTQPVTQESKNNFYLVLANSFYDNNRSKEALLYLDKVQTTDENVIKHIVDRKSVFKKS